MGARMTDDEIIEMAKQSGCHIRNGHIYNQYIGSLDQMLKKFAKLAAEKEREECAQTVLNIAGFKEYEFAANSIRARGQK